LIDAAERGDLAELGALLAAGADTEARDEEHRSTAFLWACYGGQLDCAQALVAAGCNAAAMSGADTTEVALMFAAREGHLAVVAWLLGEDGAAGVLEAGDQSGDTAFLGACYRGHLECAQALAAAGCDVATANRSGYTALMAATRSGHGAVVAWLLGEGGAVGTLEARGKKGDTAFVWACHAGHLECAQALAAAGCDVVTTTSIGTTALICAASEGHPAVVAWLLGEGGAARTLEARDKAGGTAFLFACTLGQLECAHVLMAMGCDVGTTTAEGNTALTLAIRNGHSVVVAWLLGDGEGEAAGLLEVRDERSLTAFLVACYEGQLECAQALAAVGCDVGATTSKGNTALMFAGERGHAMVLAWLLGEGRAAGMLEARSKVGCTAFHFACAEGQLECVELLLAAGCDMDTEFEVDFKQQDFRNSRFSMHGTRRMTGKAAAQHGGHTTVVARLGEVHAERTTATQRREVEHLMVATEYRAAAMLLAKMLRQAPGDAELECLLSEAEQRRDEVDAAADVLARAAEAELLAMEAREQAMGSSKAGKKREKRRRQQEKARAAKVIAEAAACARELEPEPELEPISVADVQHHHQYQNQNQPQLQQPQPQEEVDMVEALLAQLGLAEHLPAYHLREMDLGAPRSRLTSDGG
jgi:ankyrin repeat protein